MKRHLPLAGGLFAMLAVSTGAFANHVHLQIAWRQDTLVLEVYDFEAGAFPSDAFPFVIGNAGMHLIPPAPAFAFLGDAGATFFTLPQDERPGLPFLGIGVDNIPAGTFAGNQAFLRLVNVTGPGHFALYQVDAFGQPTLEMNTRDGIDSGMDRVTVAPGGHEHQNWAFSAPGEYELTFVADAVRQSNGQSISSAPAVYRFRVLPPPRARIVPGPGPSADQPTLLIRSRTGARLHLLEAQELGLWSTNATRLLSSPEWNFTPNPATSSKRFWRVQEVFE
jgi:surface-anchored protein